MENKMLEIFKSRLPEGLTVVKVVDRSNRSQIVLTMEYQGTQATGYLNKTCAPGCAEDVCDFTITTVMIEMGLTSNNLELAKEWMEKQRALRKLI